jgi:hypothetical protein
MVGGTLLGTHKELRITPKEVLPAIALQNSREKRESEVREVGGTRGKGAKRRVSPMEGMWQGWEGLALLGSPLLGASPKRGPPKREGQPWPTQVAG